MTRLTVACIQMRGGRQIADNLTNTETLISEAYVGGARVVVTPEMTNLVDLGAKGPDRPVPEGQDPTLVRLASLAREKAITLIIGSLAIALPEDGRKANRSYLITPDGAIAARYDKIHMFDVEIGDGQTYRESRSYRPGDAAVIGEAPAARIGLTICYDLRFPALYQSLARAGAQIITIPAAFTRLTGEAHWHVLLRARAIETGCFILAPAQGGTHEDGRETFGHSLIVSPWGEIIAEKADTDPGVLIAEIDLDDVAKARQRVPSLEGTRSFHEPR
ncbi:MAG: carbon-nitrogen hydrolase family protein [Pseudomonadota bacterium]